MVTAAAATRQARVVCQAVATQFKAAKLLVQSPNLSPQELLLGVGKQQLHLVKDGTAVSLRSGPEFKRLSSFEREDLITALTRELSPQRARAADFPNDSNIRGAEFLLALIAGRKVPRADRFVNLDSIVVSQYGLGGELFAKGEIIRAEVRNKTRHNWERAEVPHSDDFGIATHRSIGGVPTPFNSPGDKTWLVFTDKANQRFHYEFAWPANANGLKAVRLSPILGEPVFGPPSIY